MAVSAPNTHVYYSGNKEQCEKLRPRGFELARRMRQELEINEYLSLNLGAKTTELPNGDSFRILFCHGTTFIYILSPEIRGVYEIIEETRMAFDLYIDQVLCFSTESGERIDCTAENRCTGSGADTAGECESKRLFERTLIEFDSDAGGLVFTPRTFSFYADDGTEHFDTENFAADMALNSVCKSMMQTSTHGLYHCYKSWSKTCDQYTAHAILYYNSDVMFNMWCVVVDVDGVTYQFAPGITMLGNFLDVIFLSDVDMYNTTAAYKAFDIWKEDVVGDSGNSVPHYFVSCIGDPEEVVIVYDLTARVFSNISMSTAYDYAESVWPSDPIGWKRRHIRYIGLVKRTLYWNHQDLNYGVPTGASGTIHWENDIESGTVDLDCSECGCQFAILNEFTQEIEFMDDIACQVCEQKEASHSGPTDWGGAEKCVWDTELACRDADPGAGQSGAVVATKTSYCADVAYTYDMIADTNLFPGCENYSTLNIIGWSWDCLTDRYVCEQTGLFEGEYEENRRQRTGWVLYDDGRCFNGVLQGTSATFCDNTKIPPHVGYCYVFEYEDYMLFDTVLSAHVLPEGLSAKYSIRYMNGEMGYGCDQISQSEYDDTYETEEEFEFEEYDDNFAQLVWPYYPPYAILVAGTSCSKVIKTDKRKFSRRSDRFIDGISLKLSEEFMDANCRFDMDDDKYLIVKGNDNTLYDNKGNEFNRTFEGTDVGFFFLSQSNKKTRRVIEA